MDVKNYELTNPQKSIWLTEQYYKNTPINNICGSMYIDETVDFDILKKSIYQFVKDNDGFRLQLFYDKFGEIRQKVADFKEFEIELVNLESKNDISTLETNMTNKLFSLTENFLFNFKMYKLPDDKGGFLLVAHHLIYDAYTASLVTSKIINIYSAFKKGNNSPEVPTSYTNYINAENDYLASNKFEKDKEYWNEVFKTIPEIGSIPSIKQDNENSCVAKRETFVISKENLARINDLCYNNKISVFNFFMALYAIYIGRVSNLNDFVIGTPILNRSTFQEKNTPGTFISTVPFRFMLENKQSFIDFGRKIASDSFSMFRHQKYPYQNILDDIRKKNPSQPNLYDILISYQNARNNRNTSDIPYRTRWTFNDNVADSMQIHLFDINDDGTLSISYDYRVNKYSKNDIDNIHKRILHMIEQILEKPETVLDDIEIVTPDEKDIILNKFNETTKSYTFKNSIIEIIEDIAQKYPNNIAIEAEISSITYNELLLRINKLSNYLLKYNISENSNIGIFTTRTIDTIIGILSVLKINCTYVPIDSEYPLDRISYMIENSEINYILSENIKNLDKITNFNNIEKISINYSDYENESSILEKKYNYNYNSNLYIIFTSGSTGKPKGVTISHKNMMNLIFFEEYETSILKGNHKKILQFATMSFDVSYQEIYSSLLLGNTLVLIDDTSRKDMNKLSKYIVNKGIDTLFIPPAYLKLLVEDKEIRNLLISCVKNIITAGEALVITNGIKELIEAGISVHNHYGPAETHVATAYTITKNNISTHPPIGVPISNSNIHILDNSLHLCPIGTIGQIAISGDCVGNGYWNNDALTSEKFKINPYNNKRMYLTGDLGFFDYDGNIHFIGRADFQVKLNGFRVELDEIDQVLLNHPDVKSSVSVIHEENNKKYIITYFTENNSTSEETLIRYLNTSLPFYMIPKKLVKLDSFPINANGKIDKRNLPKVVLSDIEDEYIEPQTNTEIELSEIWKKLFNTDKIGSNYNFFDIGGDSLLAIKLSSVILAKFNVNVTVGDIFNYPTIHELSTLIDSNKNIKYNEITHCNTKEYYNLSSAQKRVYYASKMSGEDSCVYNMPGYIVFDKKPDINKLNECFKKLINRHQVLRTNFEIINNDVYQKISNTVSFEIKEVIENNKTIDEVLKDFVKPFDLSKSPLFRAKLVTSKDKILLLFDMHHIISDGLSIAILTKELSKLYNGENLDSISFNYIDYAEWEFNNLNNDNLKSSKEFWINKFKDEIPVLNMPTDYARPAIQSFSGSKIYKTISGELAEKISNLARKLDVSNYMFLLATYYILLSKYTSQEDIIVGTPVVGRNKEELLNIIGMFVNSLPLKTHIDNSMSFSDFLNIVKTNSIEAIEHQDYPFDELVNNLNLTRDSSRNPIFDTMFIYQNDGFTPISFNGLKSKLYIPDTGISKFDLSLEVVPTDKEFKLSFEYSTALFNKDTIERFSNHFINILEKIVENVNIKISEIDMLSEDEKNEILYKFNDTKMNYRNDTSYIELFNNQVLRTPDKIAVIFHNQKITYQELNEKANQIANYLIKNGVKNNDFVGLLVNRSLEMITAMIGILKAGAAYIPIDPTYPTSRINYMLEDSKVNILLSQKHLIEKLNLENAIAIDFETSPIYNDYDKNNIDLTILPNNFAYLIYTSGSTGKPKGVIINHKNINNFIVGMCDKINFSSSKNIVSITTMCFDIFVLETLLPLQQGLTIILADEDEQTNVKKLNLLCQKYNVNIIQTTPSKFSMLMVDKNELEYIKNLDSIILGGESFPEKLLTEIKNLTNANIYNVYGPTETTVWSSIKELSNANKITIGKPIANTRNVYFR